MTDKLFLTLAVNRFPGHRGWKKKAVLEACRDEKDLSLALDMYQKSCTGVSRKRSVNLGHILNRVEIEIKRLKYWNIQCFILGWPGYPTLLQEISDPPLVLYVRGHLPGHHKPAIALVGTRRPSAEGRREAWKLAMEFALADYPVVSGLAFGIDRSAHEGALAGNGKTWAVLAGGIDRPGPHSHRYLAEKIMNSGGALVGEMPPGEFPIRYAFPRRNRILSGLCRGCIVVQAPIKSGALITADFALEQNRDLYAGSSGQTGLYAGGTRRLSEEGAPVVSGAAHVLTDWGQLQLIRRVDTIAPPVEGISLAGYMKKELDGQIKRHAGGWFECCIA